MGVTQMAVYVSRMPAQPAITVRIVETSEGWTGEFVGHLNRRFPLRTTCATAAEALEQLWIRTSHLDIRPEDNRWIHSLIGRLPN
jgi:hypothetical protein